MKSHSSGLWRLSWMRRAGSDEFVGFLKQNCSWKRVYLGDIVIVISAVFILRWCHCLPCFALLERSPKALPYCIYCYACELRTCINNIQMKHNIPFYSHLNPIHLALYTDAVLSRSAPTSGGLLNLKQQYIRLVLGYQRMILHSANRGLIHCGVKRWSMVHCIR